MIRTAVYWNSPSAYRSQIMFQQCSNIPTRQGPTHTAGVTGLPFTGNVEQPAVRRQYYSAAGGSVLLGIQQTKHSKKAVRGMDSSVEPRWYHDVIGVVLVVGDMTGAPQEVFRYPWTNDNS